MTDKPSIVEMAQSLQWLVEKKPSFTEPEQAALNSLKTAIFVNVTMKNLEDFGISRPAS